MTIIIMCQFLPNCWLLTWGSTVFLGIFDFFPTVVNSDFHNDGKWQKKVSPIFNPCTLQESPYVLTLMLTILPLMRIRFVFWFIIEKRFLLFLQIFKKPHEAMIRSHENLPNQILTHYIGRWGRYGRVCEAWQPPPRSEEDHWEDMLSAVPQVSLV